MKYKKFIEDKFLIDNAESGRLVPFKFNKVQNEYYQDLIREYDIEKNGITSALRENILKARREGFSSFVLALFAADDILQDNPTETTVLSYKDDATKTFRRRYRNYVLSYFAQQAGYTKDQIADNVNMLEDIAKHVLMVDSNEIVLAHNKAHFYCGTASAKVGGRGGVLHKCLMSEVAFYPDTEKVQASEMIEATMRQIDIKSGWCFMESTENGVGTYQHKLWEQSKKGLSRFRNRFYGWPRFYTEEEYKKIESEYVDKDALRRDYPKDENDLFKGSAKNFTSEKELSMLVDCKADKELLPYWLELRKTNGIDVVETITAHLEYIAKNNKGHALYVGIDEAKDVDATIVSIIRDKRKDLTGGVKIICIDTTRGDFIADWFEKNTNWYIVRVRFSRPSKSLMYTNLQVVISSKLTSLPVLKQGEEFISEEHKHFWNQMTALEKQIIGNMLVVHHPAGNCSSQDHNYDECLAHDDYPDSWVLAEHAYIQLNGQPEKKEIPKVPTVPNAIDSLLNRTRLDRSNYGSAESYE